MLCWFHCVLLGSLYFHWAGLLTKKRTYEDEDLDGGGEVPIGLLLDESLRLFQPCTPARCAAVPPARRVQQLQPQMGHRKIDRGVPERRGRGSAGHSRSQVCDPVQKGWRDAVKPRRGGIPDRCRALPKTGGAARRKQMHATSWSWVGFSAEGRHHAPVIHQSAEPHNFTISHRRENRRAAKPPRLVPAKARLCANWSLPGESMRQWDHASITSRHSGGGEENNNVCGCQSQRLLIGGLSAEREERDWRGEPLLPHLLRLFLQWQIPETPLNLMNDKQVGVSEASGGQMQSIRSIFVQPNLKNNGVKPPQWDGISGAM